MRLLRTIKTTHQVNKIILTTEIKVRTNFFLCPGIKRNLDQRGDTDTVLQALKFRVMIGSAIRLIL